MAHAITVHNLTKTFRIPHEKRDTLKEHFTGLFKKRTYETFNVLHNLSFAINKGDFIGIIGANGSGKSTLLKILANIYTPSKGQIHVNGKLSPFLELGVGFNPELSGKENVYLNAAVLGLSKAEIDQRYKKIVEFSELERFMDMKVKNYSSGMFVRLAFSVAIQVDADILLMDEVLAVGDSNFQEKCFRIFRQLKKQGKTIILVSHSMANIEEFCDKVIYLKDGHAKMFGPTERVIQAYRKDNLQKEELLLEKENHPLKEESLEEDPIKELSSEPEKEATNPQETDSHWGSQEITIDDCVMLNHTQKPSYIFTENDKEIQIKVSHTCHSNIKQPVFGIKISNEADSQQLATNTFARKIKTRNYKQSDKIIATYIIPNVFPSGTYYLTCAVANHDTNLFYDWREKLITFSIKKEKETYGSLDLPHTIKIS